MSNLRRDLLIALTVICCIGTCLAADGSDQTAELESIDISGVYRCVGETYSGTVTIRKVGETYHLDWRLDTETYRGIGIRHENTLASTWTSDQTVTGIVLYKIEVGPKLVGKYSVYPGDGRTRTESLTFIKALEKLPEPRSWEIGESPLVNWSHDEYWYPAAVVKKEAERYFVRFDDGDEEWTDASRMLKEDIEIGDRVFANWKDRGVYYPGIVANKDGETIFVKYDDGDEETTTISYVRVLRPKER